MSTHRTVRVALPRWHLRWLRDEWIPDWDVNPIYRHERLDVGIVPLVKALWAQRIPTLWSCQGGGRWGGARVDLAPGYAATVAEVARNAGIRVTACQYDEDAAGSIFCDPADIGALAAAIGAADLRPRSRPTPHVIRTPSR